MTWQYKIAIKYDLEGTSRRIIIDSTGLLLSDEFISYLNENNFEYVKADNLRKVIDAGHKEVKLILAPVNNIPYHFKQNYSVHYFGLEDIPYNAQFEVLKTLSVNQIIQLLTYLEANNEQLSVTPRNADEVIKLSSNYINETELQKLYAEIHQIVKNEPHYNLILSLGKIWGKIVYLSYLQNEMPDLEIQTQIDTYTSEYILTGNLKSIFYELPQSLKSVDKIVKYLQTKQHNKVALICFDCMGAAEWNLLKDHLQSLHLEYIENYTFALLPSITLYSRNAIYYGNHTEVYNLTSNSQEEKALENNFPDKEVKIYREKDSITEDSILGIDFISILYNFFDDLAHATHFPANAPLTKELYFKSITEYLNKSQIAETLQTLKQEDYKIYFCSDHGSAIATGTGKRIAKYLIDKSSKRACAVPDSSLLDNLQYNQMEIPFVKGKKVVLPEGRTMFDNKGTVAITHGGITVDEIIVPFIEVK